MPIAWSPFSTASASGANTGVGRDLDRVEPFRIRGLGRPATEPVSAVGPAAFDHHRAGRFVRHRPEDHALHRWRLAPVAVVGLDHQLDTRIERHEAVRPSADRRLLETVVADALDVLL